jgi:single-stranded-DNA-specific exonuclease
MPPKPFLNITKSALGQAWHTRLDLRGEAAAQHLTQTKDISDILARILIGRGVTADHADIHLSPTIRDLLPNPASFMGMDAASARIAQAINTKERVAIFGDYDVDGACSAALMVRYFRHFGIEAAVHIPDRIFEGYGPNPDAMRMLAQDASLIITVDCGTNSANAIKAAKDAGAAVVVLDHHQQGGALPDDTPVVNPNRDDDRSGQGHLCAAGVVFVTLVAVSALLRRDGRKPPDLLSWLDLVGLATIADVVPLVGVNRAFVVKGLQVARAGGNVGIQALARIARIGEPLSPYHFGFMIGPRINAGGRIGDAALGTRLLTLDDPIEAGQIAEDLDRLNTERQAVEAKMLEEALAEADAEMAHGDGPPVIVAANEHWHPGVAGILASRLKERFQRPAFAIALNPQGIGTGSGRSINGFDLGRMVREAVETGLLVKGGGHAMAAGITVEKAKLGVFRGWLETYAAKKIADLSAERSLMIDAALSAEGATLDLLNDIEKAGPFGTGNNAPLFVLPHHTIKLAQFFGAGHLRLSLASQRGVTIKAMLFRAEGTGLGQYLSNAQGRTMHIAGTLARNHYQGRDSAEFRIIDAALPV